MHVLGLFWFYWLVIFIYKQVSLFGLTSQYGLGRSGLGNVLDWCESHLVFELGLSAAFPLLEDLRKLV